MKRLGLTFAVLVLVGCSQVDALQQVSGVPLATVRIAAYDVLVDQRVPIKEAPVCTESETEFTCSGSTLRGEAIEVRVPNDEQQVMTVSVAGEQIFSGPVQDVNEEAGE